MKSTYWPADDILEMKFSDKPIVKEISQDWGVCVSYAGDGSIVEMVILEARKNGAWPVEPYREAA